MLSFDILHDADDHVHQKYGKNQNTDSVRRKAGIYICYFAVFLLCGYFIPIYL
jgi:hypothetical protein